MCTYKSKSLKSVRPPTHLNDPTTISRVCNMWVPKWGRVGRHLSILPFIDAFTIDEMESEKFVSLDLRKVAYLKDGKDFLCDTSPVDRVINNAQQSTKIHHSAVRILTWGLPCGLSYEHTDGFLGRVGGKWMVELWTKYGRLILPVGYLGIGDKGFFATSGFYHNLNTIVCPAFLWKGIQFDLDQIGYSLQCSQGRYSIKTFYARVAKCRAFEGRVFSRNLFSYFDCINN